MKVCTCFLLFTIFACAHSDDRKNKTSKDGDRSVNLAIETVLEFNNKDNGADIKFLDKVQNFITKVKSVIDNQSNKSGRRNFKTTKVTTFTGFIQEAVNILNTYDDIALEDFFNILDVEIRKYHYKGCKFHELIENYEIRKLLSDKLDMISGKPAAITRAYINIVADIFKFEAYDKNAKTLIDYINSLYKDDASLNFLKFLSEIEYHGQYKSRNSKNDLVNIVRDGVKTMLFDHYSNLSINVRRELQERITTFWKQKYGPPPSSTIKNEIIIEEIKKPQEPPTPFTESDTTKPPENNRNRIEIKMSDYKTHNFLRNRIKRKWKSHKNKRTYKVHTKTTPISKKHGHGRHRRPVSNFTSDDSLLGAASQQNSIQFSQERQDKFKKQRYETMYPEKAKIKPTKKGVIKASRKPKKATETTIEYHVQRMWVEEATGQMQQDLLNMMTTKRHKPKQKPHHEEKTKSSKHVSKHSKHKKHAKKHSKSHAKKHVEKLETKYASKYLSKNYSKHVSKHNAKHALKHDKLKKHIHNEHGKHHKSKHGKHVVRPDVRSPNIEQQKVIKSPRIDAKPEVPLPTATTARGFAFAPVKLPVRIKPLIPQRPIPPKLPDTQTTRPTVDYIMASLGAFSKRYELFAGKPNWTFRKAPKPPTEPDKSENDKNLKDKPHRRTPSADSDPDVMNRLKDLEKELLLVKSKIDSVNTNAFRAEGAMENFEANEKLEKEKTFEDKIRAITNTSSNDQKPNKITLNVTTARKDFNIENVKDLGVKENKMKTVKVPKEFENTIIISQINNISNVTKTSNVVDVKPISEVLRNNAETDELNNKKEASKLKRMSINKLTEPTTSKTITTLKLSTTVSSMATLPHSTISYLVAPTFRTLITTKKEVNTTVIVDNKNNIRQDILPLRENINNITTTTEKSEKPKAVQSELINKKISSSTLSDVKVTNATKTKVVEMTTVPMNIGEVFNYPSEFPNRTEIDDMMPDPFQDMDNGLEPMF